MNSENSSDQSLVELWGDKKVGVIVVDHGSRIAESNQWIHGLAELFNSSTGYSIVEPAHMELAEPTIEQAFDACVSKGAEAIVLSPYFLFPGKHWQIDLPKLLKKAAQRHEGIEAFVSAPLGLDQKIVDVMTDRIETCAKRLANASRDSTNPQRKLDSTTECRFCSATTCKIA